MSSGLFDQSAIWSRTKIWRRNRSSDVCASSINLSMGKSDKGLFVVEAWEGKLGNRLLEPGSAFGRGLGLAQVQVLEVFEFAEVFQPRVGHSGRVEVQVSQLGQWREMFQTLIRHFGLAEVETGQVGQPFQVNKPRVGHIV